MLSCLIYFSLFSFLIYSPISIDSIKEYFEKKEKYLKGIKGSKIVILAGSNGRFSHRCETIEDELDLSCVNMSISAGISLNYQINKISKYLNSGDIVYLPLEYGKLSYNKYKVMSGTEIPYIIKYDLNYLLRMNLEELSHAIFYFDFKYLISSIGEMIFTSIGMEQRFRLDEMTLQGDDRNHTLEAGKQFKEFIMSVDWTPPDIDSFNSKSYGANLIYDFMNRAKEKGIIVVGGLPTTFNDKPIPNELIIKMVDFYKGNNHDFILLDNKSQYPREYFYNTSYHLSEEYQIIHSKEISQYLQNIINSNKY